MVKRARKTLRKKREQLLIPGTGPVQNDTLLFRQGKTDSVIAILDRYVLDDKEGKEKNDEEK
jgi:hypothetical protein